MDLSSTFYGFEFAKPNLKSWFKKPGESRAAMRVIRVTVQRGELDGRLAAGMRSRCNGHGALEVSGSLLSCYAIEGDCRLE